MLRRKQNLRERRGKWRIYVLKSPHSSKKSLMAFSTSIIKLTEDYTDLANKSNEATRLLSEITTMQTAITDLKNDQEQANTDQNLPLPASIALLSTQKVTRDQLTIELERKTQENTRKRREVEKLRAHLAELDRNRVDAEMFAREAEKMKNAENLQAELASKKQVGWWYDSF
jgi:septal ring factor EnvC (AmiA/AmiB activator)